MLFLLLNISMQKIKDIHAFLSEILMIKNLWSRIFLNMSLKSKKQRVVRCFILGYFKQNLITKIYENSRKLYFEYILEPFFPVLGQRRNFLENAFLSLFPDSRFPLLYKILEKAKEQILRKNRCREKEVRTYG